MNEQQYLVKFFDYLLYERGYSPLTVEAYGKDLRDFVQRQPDYLTLQQQGLEAYVESLDFAPISVLRKIAALKAFYKFLYQEDIIPLNPALDITIPKLGRRLPKVLSKKEMQRMLEPVQTKIIWRDCAILELLYSAGVRVSELIHIKLTEVDLNECCLKVKGKGDKERIVPLSLPALRSIQKYLEAERNLLKNPAEELFLSHNGLPLNRQMVWWLVKKTAGLTGIIRNISPHTFRHSLATHLIENGADIRTVQEILGHANIATTQIYTSVSREHLRRVYQDALPERK